MDWSKSLSARYEAYIVDPITWRDLRKIDILSGSISKGEDDLRESANIEVTDYDSSTEEWIRIYYDARQSSDSYYGAIFTGLISSPDKSIEGSTQKNNLVCYSVLKPSNDVLLPRGWYVSYGTDTSVMLRNLLSVIKGVPIDIQGTPPNLSETIIAEDGESNLSMVEKILYSIGWRMYIEGNGTIVISKPSSDPIEYFDPIEFDILQTSLTISNDWYGCPNVFRAVQGSFSAVAVDEDPDSPLSVQNRGREIWYEESGSTPYIGESLQQYANRRLKEEQQVSTSASYSRRYVPGINVTDLVSIRYPGQGLNGYYYISSQNISLEYAATVSEVVYKI